MSKATQLGINYRESVLKRAYRLAYITKEEYEEENQKLAELAKKIENNENAYFDVKTENFWKKIRQKVIL